MSDSHIDQSTQATQSTQSTNKSFCSLPREFVHRPLRFGRGTCAMFNLPFVGPCIGKVGRSYWAVPKTGGYLGGWETGRALAHIYMQYLRQLVDDGDHDRGHLQHIVLDMFDGDYPVNEAQCARRGQA